MDGDRSQALQSARKHFEQEPRGFNPEVAQQFCLATVAALRDRPHDFARDLLQIADSALKMDYPENGAVFFDLARSVANTPSILGQQFKILREIAKRCGDFVRRYEKNQSLKDNWYEEQRSTFQVALEKVRTEWANIKGNVTDNIRPANNCLNIACTVGRMAAESESQDIALDAFLLFKTIVEDQLTAETITHTSRQASSGLRMIDRIEKQLQLTGRQDTAALLSKLEDDS